MLFLVFGFPPAAFAADGDAFQVLVAQNLEHDSNLFRVADGRRPVIDGQPRQRADWIGATSVGGSFEHSYGRQHVRLELGMRLTDYQEFDYLDYTATNALAAWQWVAGSRWSGELSLRQNEALRSFADRGDTVRSLNTLRRYTLDANYLVLPRWYAGAGVTTTTSIYDDRRSSGSEYIEDAIEVKGSYRPDTGNSISVVARNVDGRYPQRDAGPQSVRSWGQQDLRLQADWHASGHSRLGGYLGHTWRDYPGRSGKDFNGITARIGYEWAPSGKFKVGVTARREIGAQDDIVDNYVVTRSFAVEPVWSVGSKVVVRARLERLGRDYAGNPFALVRRDRDDRTAVAGVSLEWSPLRSLGVSLAARREVRSSASAAGGYSAAGAMFGVRYVF